MRLAELYPRLGLESPREIASDSSRGLVLRASASPSHSFRQQIEQALFGNSGIRYRRLAVDQQLARFRCPVFIELLRGGEPVGTYLFCAVPLLADRAEAIGIYRALLTVRDEESGRGLGRWMSEHALDWLEHATRNIGLPVLSWGCVDANNERSLRLLESLGARRLGSMDSMLVYRQWPRETIAIEQVGEREPMSVPGETLADCAVVRTGTTPGPRYRVRGDQTRLPGATAHEVRLAMQTMGSRWDALYRHLLKFAAPARRRFDPSNFRYLRLSDLVVDLASARQWPDFVSSLLARHGLHMAMFVIDPESRQFRVLDDAGVFGRFGRATRQRIEVIGLAWHCAPDLLDKVRSAPLAIGPMDI